MKNYCSILLLLTVILSTWIFFTSPPSANAVPPPCYDYVCNTTDVTNGMITSLDHWPVGLQAPNTYTVTMTVGTCQSPSAESCTGYLVDAPFPGMEYVGPCSASGWSGVIRTPAPPSHMFTAEFYDGIAGLTTKWLCILQ